MSAGAGPVCVIVPVKGLGEAKSRLAAVLTPPQRASLVLAMLEDVLIAVRAAHDGLLLLVTPDEEYAPAARRAGAELIADAGGGYNAAVTQALAAATAREAGAALVLPADQPRAQPSELRARHRGARGARGRRSRRRATAVRGCWGCARRTRSPRRSASARPRATRALGEAAGLAVAWLELPSLRDDVDEAGDLLEGATPLGEATAAFVAGHASLLEEVSEHG